MNQQQSISTQAATSAIAPVTSTSIHPTPIDPTPIIQSESPTAVILAIAILISALISGMTGLVRVVMGQRRSGK